MIDEIVADAEPGSGGDGPAEAAAQKTLQRPAPTRVPRLHVLRRCWLVGHLRGGHLRVGRWRIRHLLIRIACWGWGLQLGSREPVDGLQ